MVLSCAWVQTLILDAAAQHNGLFHEELIVAIPGAWPTIDDGRSLNPLSECLAPFDGWAGGAVSSISIVATGALLTSSGVDPLSGKGAVLSSLVGTGARFGRANGGGPACSPRSRSPTLFVSRIGSARFAVFKAGARSIYRRYTRPSHQGGNTLTTFAIGAADRRRSLLLSNLEAIVAGAHVPARS